MFLRNLKFPVTTYRLYNRLDDGELSSTISSQALRNCARLLEMRVLRGIHRPPNNVLYNDQLDNHNGSTRQEPRQRLPFLLHRPLRRGLQPPLLTHVPHSLHDDTSRSTTIHRYALITYPVNCRTWLTVLHTLTHLYTYFTLQPTMHPRTFYLRFELIHLAGKSPRTQIFTSF